MSPTTTRTSSNAKGWFILHFTDPAMAISHDILYMNDPAETLDDACETLGCSIFERFERIADLDTFDAFDIGRLAVHCPGTPDLEITLLQLVKFLRGLPASSRATEPDLWGLGGNSMVIEFVYVGLDG